MSSTPDPTPEPSTVDRNAPAGRPPRWRWQVGLRTVFLLVAAVAVWTTYLLDRRQIATLEQRIARARPLARELVIDDEGKVAVIKLEELWYDENRWDLFLPDGRYRLCLATRQVDNSGFPPAVSCEPIGPGRHLLALEQQRDGNDWRVSVLVNGTPRLVAEEPDGWDPGRGSYGGGQFEQGTQLPADEPVVLFRRRFTQVDAQGQWRAPDGPTEGVLLWIEPLSGPAGPPPPPG